MTAKEPHCRSPWLAVASRSRRCRPASRPRADSFRLVIVARGQFRGRSASRALVEIAWRPRVSVEESRLVREHYCLDAVAEVELLEDVRDVCLDGGVADVELSADLGVREAAGDQAEHVELALCQLVELLWRRGLWNA